MPRLGKEKEGKESNGKDFVTLIEGLRFLRRKDALKDFTYALES
jgi:hypothetical protein